MKSQIKNIKIYQKVIPTSYLAMFKSILQYYFKWVILKGKKKFSVPIIWAVSMCPKAWP